MHVRASEVSYLGLLVSGYLVFSVNGTLGCCSRYQDLEVGGGRHGWTCVMCGGMCGVRGVCVGVWCVWFTNTMNNNHTILKSGDIRYDMRSLSYQLYTCS